MQLHAIHLRFLLIALLCLFPLSAMSVADDFDISSIDDEPRVLNNQHPEWFSETFLDLGEDLEDAKKEGKLGIIIYFGQKDCSYCKTLLEVNFGKEKDIVDYTRKYFNVIAIDIWGSKSVVDMSGKALTETKYAEQEKTNFTPTLLFYTTKEKPALRLIGYRVPYDFRAALAYVVGDFYKQESLRDYMARAHPPVKFEEGDLNEEPYFASEPYALDRSHFPADEPLMVLFEQGSCHSCDILHTDPLKDEVVKRMLGKFEVVQLNMWADTPVVTPAGEATTAKKWADELNIHYAPTLLMFNEEGKEVLRADSLVRLYRLRGILEYVLKKGYETAPTFQRWREDQQQLDQ